MEELGVRGYLHSNLRLIDVLFDKPPPEWSVGTLRPYVQEFLTRSLGIPLVFVDEVSIDPNAPLTETQYFNLLLMKAMRKSLEGMEHVEDSSVKLPTIKLTLGFDLITYNSEKRIDPSLGKFLMDADQVETLQINELRALLEPKHVALFEREFDSYSIVVPEMPLYCVDKKEIAFSVENPLTPRRVYQVEMTGKLLYHHPS